jgi:type IV pilus assembly protein PilY1
VAVAIGSGYQAHPLNTTIEDRFYLIKTDLAAPSSYSALSESNDLLDVTGIDSAGNVVTIDFSTLQSKKGWYIELKSNPGEKVLAPSRTANNEVWFTTFEPKSQQVACVLTPGVSRLYRINLIDGSPSYNNTIPDDTPDDDGVKPVNSCDQVECDINDRSIKLKTGALPPEPIILKINGKKLIAVGKEIMKFDTVKTTTMYWTDKE